MTNKHYLVDTDILYEHLTHHKKNKNSFLTSLMLKGECFTTILNASELYFSATTEEHKIAIKKLLYGIKVLGLNSRYVLDIPQYSDKFNNYRECLFYIVAEKNNLIIATSTPAKYRVGKVKVISQMKSNRKTKK
ncbi:MAG: PIN domain-containing protein [Ignavibacterium sp.]|uniref:PIN domain-containing protein n=1 Tax=Ignavibacterium sp. TaxID=2651167 RepID=UPI00404A0E18